MADEAALLTPELTATAAYLHGELAREFEVAPRAVDECRRGARRSGARFILGARPSRINECAGAPRIRESRTSRRGNLCIRE